MESLIIHLNNIKAITKKELEKIVSEKCKSITLPRLREMYYTNGWIDGIEAVHKNIKSKPANKIRKKSLLKELEKVIDTLNKEKENI